MMPIIVKRLDVPMNDEDIKQFMNAFEDFMKHAEVEQFNHDAWVSAKQYTQNFYEQKAAELNVPVNYYISEFV
jgi:hypothetical protein